MNGPGAWRKLRRNPAALLGLALILILAFCAAFAPSLSRRDPREQDISRRFLAPGEGGPFGTDNLGRDVFARTMHGARTSLSVGFFATTAIVLVGLLTGALSGYAGGAADAVLMRLCDFVFAIPGLLLSIGITLAVGPGFGAILIALTAVGWAGVARLIRGVALSAREEDYVAASLALGGGHARVLFRHILPNCLPTAIVAYTIGFAGAIMGEASLSFLGIGMPPSTPSWGAMVNSGMNVWREAPWMSMFPGAAIALTVFGFNLLGDGLRDALDPKTASR